MNLRTLIGYLFGRAEAIRSVAAHPRSLWIGLAFVMAAAFAREYDGEDLLNEPWHLLPPLVVSLMTSFVLYVVLRGVGGKPVPNEQGQTMRPLDGYPALLRLYWWTAPLALLYAIPYEEWMSPAGATAANLWTLGVVALWRVVLITRAVAVTWRVPAWYVLFPVMLFADALAFALLLAVPLPTISIMGGVRLSQSEAILADTAFLTRFIGCISAPLWLGGTLWAEKRLRTTGLAQGTHVRPVKDPYASRPLVVLAVLLVVGWIPILPLTQPSQRHRRIVERFLAADEVEKALAYVEEQAAADFPTHWDPPPRSAFGDTRPDPLAVLAACLEAGSPAWFTGAYVEKLPVHGGFDQSRFMKALQRAPVREQAERILRLLPEYRHAPQLVEAHRETLLRFARLVVADDDDFDPALAEVLGVETDAAGE